MDGDENIFLIEVAQAQKSKIMLLFVFLKYGC